MRKTFSLPVAATAAGGGPTPPPADTVDNIEHSVRFNSADSAYLSWTPSGAGNGQIFTHSFWTKKTTGGYAFGMGGTSSSTAFYISLFDTISVLSFGTFYKTTSAVFRDYSAWYHVVVAVDTTLATASDRIKIYVNGVQITDFSVDSAPTQNRTFNDNSTHVIGDWRTSGSYNGYIANYHKIDGQALTPSSFGFTDSNGVWQPKAYSGSYDNLLKISSSAYSTSGTSWSNTREWDDLFAETLSDAVYAADGTTYTVTFSPALTVSSEVKITKYSGQGIPTAEYVLNGSVTRTVSNFTNHVDTISSATLGGSLSSIALETVNGSDAATVIELTVDGKPVRLDTITGNGFHLDFADTSSATALGNDVSGNNNDWTPSGLVAGPAYTANSFSTEFDGTGDYLDIPSSTEFAFGTGDYTLEFWAYLTTTTAGTLYSNEIANSLILSLNSGNFVVRNYGTANIISVTAPSINTWTHIAVTRSGTDTRLFYNGVQQGSTTTNSTNFTQNGIEVGAYGNGLDAFTGKISNLRIIKGRALYTAAFTPPSTALTATDDTVLLTCQDATVRDNSNIGHSVTASGDVAVVNEGPFNGYSGSFDGSGDGLATPDITLGSNDYTLELWVYLTATGTARALYGHVLGNTTDRAISYFLTASDQFGFQHRLGDGSYINAFGSTSLKVNTWYHLAAVRVNDDYYLYVNGVLDASNTTAGANHTYYKDPAPHYIGYNRTGVSDFLGYISNVRLTVGQALYTADFTPPTADLTTTSQGATASNVKLLTCQDSTFIDNSPSAHTITVNGGASTITVNPHTDKYSVTFDGTGDYLNITNASGVAVGTGDFTVEYWVNLAATRTPSVWWASGTSSILISDTGAAEAVIGSSTDTASGYSQLIDAASSLTANTWGHVAIVRSSGTTTIYLNGVSGGTTTSITGSFDCAYIGYQKQVASRALNGKISNLRVTDGQALYTSNFLPSKEDLTTTSQGATASNVKLLTCQSYKIQDNSPSAHTITANGDAKPSTVAPFVTSGAGSFDGTGDYLSVPNSSDFAFGTGDFTVEMWVYYTGTFGGLVAADQTGAGYWASLISSDTLYWQSQNGSTNLFSTSYTNYEGKWTHVAFVRNSGTTSVYLNGTYITGAADSTNYNATGGNIDIGRDLDNVSYLTGKLSNVRISKGLARYTSNFTPPTEDFDPTDQDTTFLALQGNTLDDLAGDHAVSALGNAATSTVSPFEPVDGSDAMLDSPTNYGSGDTVRGNYCTLNPLNKATNGGSTNGNFEYLSSGGNPNGINGTMAVSSGKWLYESIATNNAYGSGNPVYQAGFIKLDNWDGVFGSPMLRTTGFYGYSYRDGYKSVNGTDSTYAAGAAIGDVIGLALDLDAGELEIYKNGTSLGVLATGLSGTFIPCVESNIGSFSGQAATVNFGQQPFKYPVAGYKAWCSTNLPTPAVADGSTAMDVALYTGTSSGAVVSTPNMSPDVVWIKDRGNTFNHQLFDTIRGANSALLPNLTSAENNYNSFTSFDSTGFTVPNVNGTGANGNNHVAWTWDAGSSTVSNTDGTITSQVRANPTAGISIVTYNGTSNSTIGHGLQAKPSLIVVKNRDNTSSWQVYSEALGATKYLILNLTNGEGTNIDRWNDTEPTSSVFTVGSNAQVLGNCVAYCFAPVEGFSAFGSFTCNGTTDNTFVHTGMRPRWLMIKKTSTTGSWIIFDAEREGYNVDNDPLWANLTNQESTANVTDILSNGFKIRDSAFTGDYIYAAFAEHPFKTSRAR